MNKHRKKKEERRRKKRKNERRSRKLFVSNVKRSAMKAGNKLLVLLCFKAENK